MSGPSRHGPTRPPIPHHPSVGLHLSESDRPKFAPIRAEVDARNAVVDAAIAETNAETAVNRAVSALQAHHDSHRIPLQSEAVQAREDARTARRAAVEHLLTTTEAPR